jgi:hypothetical protein
MKGGPGFEQMRSLAGVDDNDTFSMLDNPYVCGQPFGPVLISEDGEPSSQPVSAPFDLRALYPDGTGPDRMVSAQAAHPSACRSKLAGRNEDFAVREMCEAPVMIHVQMGETPAPQ